MLDAFDQIRLDDAGRIETTRDPSLPAAVAVQEWLVPRLGGVAMRPVSLEEADA